MNTNPFRKIYLEALKGDQHKLDANNDGKIEGEDLAKLRNKKIKKEATEVPFSGPYTKATSTVTDKSGAKHSPMSRAKHLAQMAAKKAQEKKSSVKEEVEEIDELNKSTLASYASKAAASAAAKTGEVEKRTAAAQQAEKRAKDPKLSFAKSANQQLQKHDTKKAGEAKAVAAKRLAGVNRAVTKMAKEEVEQIDELSKSTLASYTKKATKDARMQQSIGKDFEASANKSRKPSMKDAAQSLADKYKSKSRSREAGIGKAVDRLAKEEVEEGYIPPAKPKLTPSDTKTLGKVAALMAKEKAEKAARDAKMKKEEVEQIEEKSDQAKRNKTMKNLMSASKGAQINRGLKLDPAEYGYKKAQHLNKAIGRAAMRAEETEMEFTQEELQLIEQFIEIAEKMNMSKASMGDVIRDFKKSDAPQFKGKSEEKRRQMAIAAKLQADRETKKEEVNLVSFKGFNLDEVKMADLPSRKVSGSYGTEYYKKEKEKDKKGYDDTDDDKEPSEKKGRGRPAGSKSGARQKGSTTGKKKSGVEMTGYPLHLPNR